MDHGAAGKAEVECECREVTDRALPQVEPELFVDLALKTALVGLARLERAAEAPPMVGKEDGGLGIAQLDQIAPLFVDDQRDCGIRRLERTLRLQIAGRDGSSDCDESISHPFGGETLVVFLKHVLHRTIGDELAVLQLGRADCTIDERIPRLWLATTTMLDRSMKVCRRSCAFAIKRASPAPINSSNNRMSGRDAGRERKSEPHQHAGRVSAHRHVDVAAQFAELDHVLRERVESDWVQGPTERHGYG